MRKIDKIIIHWAAKAAKWTLTMAAFFTAIWHGTKVLIKVNSV